MKSFRYRFKKNTGNNKTTMEMMSDRLETLPVDDSFVEPPDIHLVEQIFKENKEGVGKIASELKPILLVGIIYVLMSIPQVDEIIKKFLPFTRNSTFMFIGFKALVIMILLYFFSNLKVIKLT